MKPPFGLTLTLLPTAWSQHGRQSRPFIVDHATGDSVAGMGLTFTMMFKPLK